MKTKKMVGCHVSAEEKNKMDKICNHFDITNSFFIRKSIQSKLKKIDDQKLKDEYENMRLSFFD